jgi:hypothetical protein
VHGGGDRGDTGAGGDIGVAWVRSKHASVGTSHQPMRWCGGRCRRKCRSHSRWHWCCW